MTESFPARGSKVVGARISESSNGCLRVPASNLVYGTVCDPVQENLGAWTFLSAFQLTHSGIVNIFQRKLGPA